MIIVGIPEGTRLPLGTLIPSTPGRMMPVKDPITGMTTMKRSDPVEMDDAGVVFRLTMDMLGFAQDTPHADDADVDALIFMLRDQPVGEWTDAARAVMKRLASEGWPYPYADRLRQSLDAMAAASTERHEGTTE